MQNPSAPSGGGSSSNALPLLQGTDSHSISRIPPIRIPPQTPLPPSHEGDGQPISEISPSLRKIRGSPAVREGMQFILKPTAGTEKFYTEFRGRGSPPANQGEIGDIFWDLGPPFVIYVRCPTSDGQTSTAAARSKWEAWNRDSSTKQPLAKHPVFQDRYLWVSAGRLGWFGNLHLKQNRQIRVQEMHALDEMHLSESSHPPTKVASPTRVMTTNTGQSNDSPQTGGKRKRESEGDSDGSRRHLKPPQTFDQIPQWFRSLLSPIEQTLQEAYAGLPMIDEAVAEETDLLGDSATEVQKLRSEIASKNTAIAETWSLLESTRASCESLTTKVSAEKANALAKEIEAANIRETLEKMLGAVTLETAQLKGQYQEQLAQQELAHAEARKQDQATITELQSVLADYIAKIERDSHDLAGSLARFKKTESLT